MGLASVLWIKDVLVAVLVLLASSLLYNLFVSAWWRPLRIKRAFEAQGIPCLPFRFVQGSLPEIGAMNREALRLPMPHVTHDILPRILPHFHHWGRQYGDQFIYWLGFHSRFNLTNVDDVKEILSTNFQFFPKPNQRPDTVDLLGNGLVSLEGERWAQHRRIMNPAFFLEKLKALIPRKAACTAAMIDKWGTLIEEGQAIDVHTEFTDLTADIIAHTSFGSSFAEGKRVFELQAQQQILTDKLLKSPYIPGARFLPTAFNRLRWRVDRDIKRGLRQVINNRLKSMEVGRGDSYGNDLLDLMISANKAEQGDRKKLAMTIDDIIDECKTFFFAGHETTANWLTWTVLLLALNPAWQERLREEVQATCGMKDLPTADSLSRLRTMGMVLNEALRLYPTVVILVRKAVRDVQVGKIMIPKETGLVLPILALHHDERYWGSDVNEFRPERFSEGIAKASRVAGAFMPFGMGPRVCIGQNFAGLEAKVVLSIVLQHFRFRLSPAYQHSPISVFLTLKPQFGVPILFEKL